MSSPFFLVNLPKFVNFADLPCPPHSQSFLKFMSIESVMLSNHLILSAFFSFCLWSFLASGFFAWVGSSHQVAKYLEIQLQHQSLTTIYALIFIISLLPYFTLLFFSNVLKWKLDNWYEIFFLNKSIKNYKFPYKYHFSCIPCLLCYASIFIHLIVFSNFLCDFFYPLVIQESVV